MDLKASFSASLLMSSQEFMTSPKPDLSQHYRWSEVSQSFWTLPVCEQEDLIITSKSNDYTQHFVVDTKKMLLKVIKITCRASVTHIYPNTWTRKDVINKG